MNSTQRRYVALAGIVISLAATAQEKPVKEPEELKRLRQQYQQRREAALKPITAGYQQQLELLVKSLTQRNDLDGAIAVRKELESLKSVDPRREDLRSALLDYKWSWTGAARETDVFLTFLPDGTCSHRGGRQTWTITGPREVKLVETGGGRTFILRFDEALENYRCIDGPELHGRRMPK
jgi:hypothetical protein